LVLLNQTIANVRRVRGRKSKLERELDLEPSYGAFVGPLVPQGGTAVGVRNAVAYLNVVEVVHQCEGMCVCVCVCVCLFSCLFVCDFLNLLILFS
jgi:hypothetical protein